MTGSAVVGAAELTSAVRASVATLAPVADRDWERRAGDLDWTCRRTLDHVVDALLLYSAHLARRATGRLELVRDGDRGATVAGLLDAAGSAASILAAVVAEAGPQVRAFHPAGLADPSGFAAMGCDEVLIHTDDIARGLGAAFEPPADLCAAVLGRLFPWAPAGVDPWEGLRWANGRASLPGHERLGPDWYWHCAPLDQWDGTVARREQPPAW